MRAIGWLILLLSVNTGIAQKFVVKQSEISFASHAELELIKASSTKLAGIIDGTSNQLAFKVDNRSFTGFNSGLQREHFNEKYIESEKFPASSFTGKIIEKVDFSTNGVYDIRVKGELDIHGQKQIRIIKGKITVRDNVVFIETTFNVPLADHNISIPKIVSQKIATEIEVYLTATLMPNNGG